MNNRQSRMPARPQPVPIARGPHAHPAAAPSQQTFATAPHAALLIDFDNVTMGIRSDLAAELKSLLSSNIVQGKIAIQRAYADWRRYPQYVLPLTEASIDLIYAPAYGSARKNATDIRLAIDAMELVFTRPEIGTIILLSGDSDFSSLVIKLKEYGKYVIGVGIRESSSDLLVQNCDEYFSYNALAGLVRSGDEQVAKWDPWELVVEAITRMRRNGDVMRSDRLKQVMQEIDNTFDEKNLGMSKFSRFVSEAAQRGLISMTKLENGQIEVGAASARGDGESTVVAVSEPEAAGGRDAAAAPATDSARERGTRGRRGRGRGPRREREGVKAAASATSPPAVAPTPAATPPVASDRLTRAEALDLVKRAVEAVSSDGTRTAPASTVREKARELLGRDSETLSERHFSRILQDAHDADLIDLRRRGNEFEVARVVPVDSVAEQLSKTATTAAAAAGAAAQTQGQPPRPGARSGRAGFGRKHGEIPADLFSIGVVGAAASPSPSPSARISDAGSVPPTVTAAAAADEKKPAAKRKRGGRKTNATATKAAGSSDAAGSDAAAPRKAAKKTRVRKTTAKKAVSDGSDAGKPAAKRRGGGGKRAETAGG